MSLGDRQVQIAEDREDGRLVVLDEILISDLERLDADPLEVPAPVRFELRESRDPVVDLLEFE